MTPLGDGLDRLVAEDHLHRWWLGIYEPETAVAGYRLTGHRRLVLPSLADSESDRAQPDDVFPFTDIDNVV